MFGRFLSLIFSVRPDFVQFYEAGKMVNSGLNPYLTLLTSIGPFNYPPLVLPFFSLFALFDLETASIIFNILSVVCLVLSIHFCLKIIKVKPSLWQFFLIFFLTFFSFPVKFTLGMGQINHLVLLFIVMGIYFLISKKSFLSGVFFGLAGCFKLSPFIFIILFLYKKDWKGINGFLSTSLFLFLLSGFFLSFSHQVLYYTDIFFRAFSPIGKEVYYNQALSGFISRKLGGNFYFLSFFLSLTLLLITILSFKRISLIRQITAILSLMILVNAISWQHHLVFLLPVFFILFEGVWRKKNLFRIVLLTLSLFLVSINLVSPQNYPVFFQSHGFLGVIILWVMSIF